MRFDLEDSRFVLQFLDQLRRDLRRRTFDELRLFVFDRQVDAAKFHLGRELGRVNAERGEARVRLVVDDWSAGSASP